MKIKPNAISIIEEILNNPEKDFTEENIYTQLVQVTEEDFTNAIIEYQKRERRFGKTSKQL